jgi:O-antigen/teichoic acid export membrane protein
MPLFPKIAFNTLVQIIGRGVVIGLTIITTALLTRRLGVAGYGDYVFLTAFLTFFSSIADWGTGIISVREASREKNLEKKIFGNALILRLAIATLSFLIINFSVFLLPQFSGLILPAVIASTLLFFWSLRTSCQIIFQTKLRFDQHALVEVFSSSLFVLFLIGVLSFSSALAWIFLALSTSGFLAALLALALAWRLTSFDFRLDFKLMKKILSESLPTGALLLLFSVYNRLDIFLLQSIKGAESVGVYGLAYKVHDNLVLGAAFLANAFFQ